ncbi:molybdopterin-dependent oxidoreductase [Raoultibacter massiliensis]|uniref:molybdopterin-dependent oxidoreductase n=1 Tax=Raoultibacter massiliensis TaxID=1852371 RepID=UPI003A9252E0
MSKTTNKIMASMAGAVLLASGAGAAFGNLAPAIAESETEPTGTVHTVADFDIASSWLGEEAPYKQMSNVEGTFEFDQEGVTPNDELFNVFGTAILSMCSKPAPELEAEQTGVANYYINVGGNIQKGFTLDLSELDGEEQEMLMGCSCATGSPFGQASVIGVPLASVIGMADLEEGVNTITAYGADGFGQPLPLQYALEKNALLVYKVNGQELKSSEGSSVQLWMPETVARYFTRNIASIELTREEAVPKVQQVDPTYRNKIEIKNSSDGCTFKAGDQITFEGVADDCGSPVTAIEFSFDGGRTWTACETEGATADKWVNWHFTTSFEETGDYEMTVRARTADDVVSPLSASLTFEIA